MGWSSANEIFDPTARAVIEKVKKGNVEPDQATDILYTLIEKLQEGDWDTEDESLEEFAEYPYVVEAFARANVHQQFDLESQHGIKALIMSVLAPMDETETKDSIATKLAVRLSIALDER